MARALALYRSLERSDPDFVLRAVCMDTTSRELLRRLALPRCRTVPIEQIEDRDPELRAVRASRTSWEYCWTATPAVCRYFLETEPELELLTYLDADLYIWSSPQPLFDELGDRSVLLIPHRSETEHALGVYNVGWLTFRNDALGLAAVRWWRERCLEWCYDRVEPGRYGDQKYLDDWPVRFEGVRVSALAAAGVAPWNESRHRVSPSPGGGPPLVDGTPLIYFHHTGIHAQRATGISRLLARRTGSPERGHPPVEIWRLPPGSGDDLELVEGSVRVIYAFSTGRSVSAVRQLVWHPYMASLTAAIGELAAVGMGADRPGGRLLLSHSRELLRQFVRHKLLGPMATGRRPASGPP